MTAGKTLRATIVKSALSRPSFAVADAPVQIGLRSDMNRPAAPREGG